MIRTLLTPPHLTQERILAGDLPTSSGSLWPPGTHLLPLKHALHPKPSLILPQGLCTCIFLFQECSCPRDPHLPGTPTTFSQITAMLLCCISSQRHHHLTVVTCTPQNGSIWRARASICLRVLGSLSAQAWLDPDAEAAPCKAGPAWGQPVRDWTRFGHSILP